MRWMRCDTDDAVFVCVCLFDRQNCRGDVGDCIQQSEKHTRTHCRMLVRASAPGLVCVCVCVCVCYGIQAQDGAAQTRQLVTYPRVMCDVLLLSNITEKQRARTKTCAGVSRALFCAGTPRRCMCKTSHCAHTYVSCSPNMPMIYFVFVARTSSVLRECTNNTTTA